MLQAFPLNISSSTYIGNFAQQMFSWQIVFLAGEGVLETGYSRDACTDFDAVLRKDLLFERRALNFVLTEKFVKVFHQRETSQIQWTLSGRCLVVDDVLMNH